MDPGRPVGRVMRLRALKVWYAQGGVPGTSIQRPMHHYTQPPLQLDQTGQCIASPQQLQKLRQCAPPKPTNDTTDLKDSASADRAGPHQLQLAVASTDSRGSSLQLLHPCRPPRMCSATTTQALESTAPAHESCNRTVSRVSTQAPPVIHAAARHLDLRNRWPCPQCW